MQISAKRSDDGCNKSDPGYAKEVKVKKEILKMFRAAFLVSAH